MKTNAWYRLTQIPDLTLNKYASLEENGVDGVLEKHNAFLRQLNRMGIVSGLSYHLFYFYLKPKDAGKDSPGHRLQVYFMVRGEEEVMKNASAFVKASPLADFYQLESVLKGSRTGETDCSISNVLANSGLENPEFRVCTVLTKMETILPASAGETEDYYLIREWETNEDGRLYNMFNMMEALDETALYRVDLYPVERSDSLREALRKPMGILRKKQEERGFGSRKDYDGKDVLKNYEDMIENIEESPHFICNIMVFSNEKERGLTLLDAAGAEALKKGKYNLTTFGGSFHALSFLEGEPVEMENMRERMMAKRGKFGLIVCREDAININLNYLPTLFTMEEIAPFFRFPALYDGETIQIVKETAPPAVDAEGSLYLGKDVNGYDVYFPLNLFPKHVFVSGVPGSGKTNTMHHITSSLWKRRKEERIPFLVLEPAKQEYRALANDPEMAEMYLFSPNADMSFPLHINPFEMPKGILVAEHIRRLCSVFEGAFPLEPPMPFLLDTAIEAVYRELGWIPEHVYTGEEKTKDGRTKRPLPTMSMLYRKLEEELNTTHYSDEVRGNLESALKVRIGSLLRREMGDVFDVPMSTFTPERWLEVPAVIELESMGTGPANFLTLMLCSLIRETLKAHPLFDGDLRHVIFIEEAHNLIGPESEEQTGADADPKLAATAFVVKMLAEVRALKEGIVIADQLPTVMAQEVLKNTGLKIGLRITSSDDRSLLGGTMSATSLQLEQMGTFAVGEALIFYEKLKRPFTMRVKEWFGEIEDRKEKEAMVSSKNDADLRQALAQNKAFLDANLRSIRIITDKYYFRFMDLQEKIRKYMIWAENVVKLNEMMEQKQKEIEEYEKGRKVLSAETAQKLNDQYDQVTERLYKAISRKEDMEKGLEIIDSVAEWINTLERLKNGRWKRFTAPDIFLMKVCFLQSSMCDTVINVYQKLGLIRGGDQSVLDRKEEVKEITELSIQITNTLMAYMDANKDNKLLTSWDELFAQI